MRRDRVRPSPVPSSRELPAAALLERLEDPLAVRLGDADAAVGDGDVDVRAVVLGADHHRPAVAGELDRVGDQVEHDLLEPELVGVDQADVVGDHDAECDAVRGGSLAEHRGGVLEEKAEVERGVLQLHPPGLDLGEVEDLVEQLQQVLARSRGCRAGTPPGAR